MMSKAKMKSEIHNDRQTRRTSPYKTILTTDEKKDLKLFYSYDPSRCKEEIRRAIRRRRFRLVQRTVRYAAILLAAFLTVGITLHLHQLQKKEAEIDLSKIESGSPKAVLELPSGKTLALEDEQDGVIANLDEVTIRKNSDFIAYDLQDIKLEQSTAQQTAVINKIFIPRGGEYKVCLADGTEVWLNAGSELTYPAKFNHHSRTVHLDGEGYFVVAKSDVPFVVATRDMDITVLGTRFNVSSYADDGQTSVTLEEGSVKATASNGEQFLLTPGDRLSINSQTGNSEATTVDPRNYTAWKDGTFVFCDEPIQSIARKLSRWYNVDFIPDDNLNIHFTGTIHRYESILSMIEVLELTGEIKCLVGKDAIRLIPGELP